MNGEFNLKYEIILPLIELEKIEGLDNNQSKKIIAKAKEFINLKEENIQKAIIEFEKNNGHLPSYYQKVCWLIPQQLADEYRKTFGMRDLQEMINADLEANRQEPTKAEPSEEEKQQAMAQQNASSNPTWEYTAGGIGYWNYGNGFGWAPPNPIRDKIISGLSISNQAKRMLMTDPKENNFFAP